MPRVKGGAAELNRLLDTSYIAGMKDGQHQDTAEKGAWMVVEALGWKIAEGDWRTSEEFVACAEREKAVDVTENFIRVRVRRPGEFQPDTFRTITLSKRQGIQAVIGRLKGKQTTERQSILFRREKGWTSRTAVKWVKDHGMTSV
jgi:hypothetical protein